MGDIKNNRIPVSFFGDTFVFGDPARADRGEVHNQTYWRCLESLDKVMRKVEYRYLQTYLNYFPSIADHNGLTKLEVELGIDRSFSNDLVYRRARVLLHIQNKSGFTYFNLVSFLNDAFGETGYLLEIYDETLERYLEPKMNTRGGAYDAAGNFIPSDYEIVNGKPVFRPTEFVNIVQPSINLEIYSRNIDASIMFWKEVRAMIPANIAMEVLPDIKYTYHYLRKRFTYGMLRKGIRHDADGNISDTDLDLIKTYAELRGVNLTWLKGSIRRFAKLTLKELSESFIADWNSDELMVERVTE